jgi:hypothetical protein
MVAAALNPFYEPKAYNALGTIEVVDKLVTEDQIFQVGKLILE